MKFLFAVFSIVILIFSAASAAEGPDFKDQRNKESYSLGYQFGENLKRQGVDIDADAYIYGIRDSMGGKEPRVGREEMRGAVLAVQNRVMAAQKKEFKEKAAKNLDEGRKFLAENAKKEGVITLPSGLQYKVLASGSGKTPALNSTVTVHYKGMFIDGTEFDSSYNRGEPTPFQVKGLIRGWNEALQLMKEGDKWLIFVPPELAYGERGAGDRIPPNATLIFEVTLISVQ